MFQTQRLTNFVFTEVSPSFVVSYNNSVASLNSSIMLETLISRTKVKNKNAKESKY